VSNTLGGLSLLASLDCASAMQVIPGGNGEIHRQSGLGDHSGSREAAIRTTGGS
jgi:hypothetical protein